MPAFVMKVDRERDLYVEWSTVAENWTRIGTRAEMLAHLKSREPRGYTANPGNTPEDRLRRADETGTSALFYSPPFEGAWDDSGLIVEQRGILARTDIGRYVDAVLADDETAALALLRPFEDDEEVRDG